jgi:hypothetical protein
VLWGGAIVLLAIRLVLSLARSGPVVMADEAGYLMHARVLAGGMPAEMGSSPFYRGGYSLLLAPVVGLGDDPVLAYHGVLVVNALLAASLVPLLFVLLTRCFDVARGPAAWAAVAGAAYPSVTALSQVALSENLLFPLMVAWLLAAGLLLRRPSAGAAVAAGACAALLWAAHGRMVVVAGLTAAMLPALAILRRRRDDAAASGTRRRHDLLVAASGLIVLAGGLAGGSVLNSHLLERNYDGPRLDETERALSSLGSLDGIVAVLENLAGHGWYLLVATLGLALLLFAGEVPAACMRFARREPKTGDAVLLLTALTTVGLLLASALWFSIRDRPDQLVYGRYVEPVAPVLIAVALGVLARTAPIPRPRALVLGLAGLTAVVAVVRAGLDLPVDPSRWNVASMPSVTGQIGPPVIVLGGLVAGAAVVLLVWLRRAAPGALAPVVLALFVPTTAYVAYLPVLRSQRDVYPAGWTSPRPVVEALGATRVGYDLDGFDHIAVKAYQWAMPQTRFVLSHSRDQAPPAALFFGDAELSGAARRGARIVWRDAGRDQVLWRVGAR